MPDFEIRSIPQQHIAAIRLSAAMDQVGEVMGQAFPKLYQAVTEAGAVPAGPPLTRYFSYGGPIIEFECAIPVAERLAGAGDDDDVKPGEIGGGEAAVGMHVGPYDTIGATWEAIGSWVEEQSRVPSDPAWESYLTDPSEEPNPAKWMTEVCMPLR